MVDVLDLHKAHGAQRVLEGVTFKIAPSDRLALVGPNGSGKTTILRMLAGEESPDRGEIRRRRGLEVGYLPQELEVGSDRSLLEFVEDVAEDVRHLEREIRELEAVLSSSEGDAEALDRYGHLQTRYEHIGGYQLRARAERILAGLGFREEDHSKDLRTLSGGWRMRAALARILLREPDLVLLDEPTNHLDIVSLEWLEAHLLESSDAYLIVSHDISFLDRVVDGVLALEGGRVVRTKGNYSRYEEERDLREAQAAAAYENYRRKRASTEAFIERFRAKATKARQVQSRIRQLEREEAPPPPPSRPAGLSLRLPQPERSGRTVAELEGVAVGYSGIPVYRGLDFRVDRGEKVALIGPNGAGKSTLLRLLAGVLQPQAGRVSLGHRVTVSYFAQHQLEQLNPRRSVLGELMALPGMRSELEARSILGSFLFSGDEVEKSVAVLSGGEKSRLVLAKLFAEPGNFLLLDEPTNHLDIQACSVLKKALVQYEGTLCVITHDRDLINRVASRVVYVEGGSCRSYLGNYDDFQRKRGEEEAEAAEDLESTAKRSGRREHRRLEAERRARVRRETEPLRERVKSLEADVADVEGRLAEVEHRLADPETYSSPERAAALARERSDLDRKLQALTEDWERAATLLEVRERDLAEEGAA